MGRLPIHEAHQHHSALIPQEYKNPPPAPVFPLCPARCRPAAPAPVSSSCSVPPCRSTATRLSLHPTRRRRPGTPCFAAGQAPPFGLLLPDVPSPWLPPPRRRLLLVACQIPSYSHRIRPPQTATVFTDEFSWSFSIRMVSRAPMAV
jgi:hypothetical protein